MLALALIGGVGLMTRDEIADVVGDERWSSLLLD
jgi:hypothetical protein